MARDSSGDYTLPAGNPVPYGTRPASSSNFNATLTDVATELTDSLSRSGKGAMLADLDMDGFDIVDGKVGGNDIGYRKIVRASGSGKTFGPTDVGRMYATTGNCTVADAVLTGGDAMVVYNNSANPVSIIQGSGVTMRLAGTATTGSRTLAAYGLATILMDTASIAVVSGAGVS